MPKKRTRIDTEDKNSIALLAARGKTANAIAGIIDRDPKTIRAALADQETMNLVSTYQEQLADKFEKLTDRILDAVSDEDVTKASLQQKVIAAATTTDKARLLRGQSTVNLAAVFSAAMED